VWLSPLFRELNLVAAHAVVDDCERIVERGDAFAGDLLEKELRLFSAGSLSVFSPLIAANAAFALKGAVWFRRARLFMVSPDPRRSSPLSGRKSTYRPVKIR
jgi:hypothetical protein